MIQPIRGRWLNVVTAAPPAVTAPADLAAVVGCADLVELRFDLLGIASPEAVAAWIEASPRPVLATVRSEAEGGAFAGSPSEAAALLRAALRAGAHAIDVEAATEAALVAWPDGLVVASSHTWAEARVRRRRTGCRKRAVPVATAAQLREAERIASEPGFVVPYGPLACLRTLFVGPASGMGLLFGAASVASPAAPGQPPLRALLDELRAGEVSAKARRYGLVGRPPAWSPSPAMHNSVFRHEQKDALYVPIGPMAFEEVLGLGLRGFSVTTPFKREAYEAADEHDAQAARSGIVNTMVQRDDGTWLGLDTDSRAIAQHVGRAPHGREDAFVYGAGAFARAATVTLRARGYDVRLAARDAARGGTLAAALDVPFVGATYERRDTDGLLFNATPAGAVDDDVTFVGDASLEGLLVLDAPYRAGGPTALVRRAEDDGAAAVVEGRSLLLEQAVHQARAFGSRTDEDTLRRLLGLGLRPPPSLWLVGLRGSGKTTLGALVARRLGRPFVDLDAEVRRTTGHLPDLFIRKHGWAAFRSREAEIVERVRHRHGVVIATGGGLIGTPEVLRLLEGLPCVGYLHVPPATAAARVADAPDERPRLPGVPAEADESEAAYSARDARYRQAASFVVDADRRPENVVRDLARRWLARASDFLANNVES